MKTSIFKICFETKVVSLNNIFLYLALLDITLTKIALSHSLAELNPLYYILGEPVFLFKMICNFSSMIIISICYFYLKVHNSRLVQLPFFCWVILIAMQLHAVLFNLGSVI